MKIAICASLDFTDKVKEIAEKLKDIGHEIIIPVTSEMILNNKITLEDIKKEKENGDIWKRMVRQNSIKRYCKLIEKSEAILVLNFDKKGIRNYIGGNVFLEMGFAHITDKKIFLLNDVPDVLYKDEIKAMQPVILNGDLSKIG
jgi:hypothetical protein